MSSKLYPHVDLFNKNFFKKSRGGLSTPPAQKYPLKSPLWLGLNTFYVFDIPILLLSNRGVYLKMVSNALDFQ